MINLIESYVNNLSKNDVLNFAQRNNINLSTNELDFTYNFIKKNYQEIINKERKFDFSKYRGNFTEENFNKISLLIKKYSEYL